MFCMNCLLDFRYCKCADIANRPDMKGNSDMNFGDWFEKQFGKEPESGIGLSELWDKADTIRRELQIAEYKIKSREQWLDNRKAALYAWTIKDKDKK